MNKQYLTAQLLQLAKEGKDYNDIRKKAKSYGFNQQELKAIMWQVDDLLLQQQALQSEKGQANEWILIGLFIMILSIIATAYVLLEKSIIFYITIAGFLGGTAILHTGWQYRKKLQTKKEQADL